MSLYLIADSEAEKLAAMVSKFATVSASEYENATADATPMLIDRGVAQIEVAGILEPERVALYDYWGVKHTAYSDITAQAVQARNDGAKKIKFNIRSGGGNVEGMLPAMKVIKKIGIPTTAVVSGMSASAAFMLASQCDTIECTSELDILGSIGVVTSAFSFPFLKEVTNTASPNKRPDIKTEEGLAAVKEELDDIYGVVIPHVAKGRNTSIEKINSDWGRGGTMTAKTALSRGMIDSINEPKPAGRSGKAKGSNMDINKLKADHPDLYAAVLAEGKEIGKAEFQELAAGHVGLAELSGDNSRAMADIAAGNSITPACQIHHTTAATKRSMIEARGEEAPDAIGEGKDPQKEASPEAKNEDDILVADSKAYYKAMGVINV